MLTFDLDFGDLLATGLHQFPSVIIFRLRDQSPPSMTTRLTDTLAQCSRELMDGAIVIVEDAGYRLRRLPIRS